MTGKLLEIGLFGTCSVQSVELGGFAITGAKHKALFALLATAQSGRRTRSFLQETLWGRACYDTGRQSLRRALADIKELMGESYGELLSISNTEVGLNLARVQFVGHVNAGPFLEGLDIHERGFMQWVSGVRQNPGQLAALFGFSHALITPILPVISVLPFRAVGGAELDSVLGDWLAEEICRSLSRSNLLAVISHLSCRELARGTFDIAAVRKTLKADYCVVGTLRRSGGKLVLDADFVDARSGRIIWTRQFAHRAAHFVDNSAEGMAAILAAIGAAIADEAVTHVRGFVPAQIEDHRLLLAGVALMHRSTLRDFARAREFLEEAQRRAPHAPEIYAWLGKWYILSVFNGWSSDIVKETGQAVDYTARALDISPSNAFSLTIDGFAQNNLLRRLDIAEQRYTAALQSNPNFALSWLLKGVLHAFRDEGAPAVDAANRACKLSPLDPFGYFYDSLNATACLAQGDYERSLELANRSLSANDRHLSTLRTKIVALHNLGRRKEAIQVGQELLRRQPTFTVANYRRSHPAADYFFGKNAAAALKAAGIP